MGSRSRRRLALVAVTALGAAVAAPAAPVAAAQSGEPQFARAAAAPWCGKVIWTGAKTPTATLAQRLARVEKIIDNVDIATDAATIALIGISGGAAVPAAAVKGVAKLGARMISRVVKRLRSDLAKVNKRRAGVRLRMNCVAGVVPYPSLGVYT